MCFFSFMLKCKKWKSQHCNHVFWNPCCDNLGTAGILQKDKEQALSWQVVFAVCWFKWEETSTIWQSGSTHPGGQTTQSPVDFALQLSEALIPGWTTDLMQVGWKLGFHAITGCQAVHCSTSLGLMAQASHQTTCITCFWDGSSTCTVASFTCLCSSCWLAVL